MGLEVRALVLKDEWYDNLYDQQHWEYEDMKRHPGRWGAWISFDCLAYNAADDGVYCWGPFNPPRRGLKATYEHHKNALSHQTDWRCRYAILAVSEEHGIARFRLTLKDDLPGEPNTYDGIFLVRLNDQGKCTLFEEWYHSTTTQADEP